MAKNMIMKTITSMILFELIMIASAHNNGDHVNMSPACLTACQKFCTKDGHLDPVCLSKCISVCWATPIVSDHVRVCTSSCVQSSCAKFIDSGNLNF